MTSAVLHAALVSLVSIGTLGRAHGPAVTRIPAPAGAASIMADTHCSPLPGVPRALEAALAGDQVVVSWAAPTSSGCTPLSGYVVILSPGEPLVVSAATTRVTLPWRPDQQFSVAAMNAVGCSLRTGWVSPEAVVATASAR